MKFVAFLIFAALFMASPAYIFDVMVMPELLALQHVYGGAGQTAGELVLTN